MCRSAAKMFITLQMSSCHTHKITNYMQGRPCVVARTNQKDRCFFRRELSVTVSRQDVHCISERSRTVPYKRLIKQILRRRATTQGRPYAHPQNNIRFQITMNLDNSVILIFCDFPNRSQGQGSALPVFCQFCDFINRPAPNQKWGM